MSQQREGLFKRKVVRDLVDDYGQDIKILVTQERGRSGVLDLNICLFGDHIEIELKTDGNKPTKLQQVSIDRVIRAGGLAFFTTPSEWEGHRAVLRDRYAKQVRSADQADRARQTQASTQ